MTLKKSLRPYYTPGRGKIVPCNVNNNQTSQLARKAYEDSDYTTMIAVMHSLKRHLGGGVLSAFVFP